MAQLFGALLIILTSITPLFAHTEPSSIEVSVKELTAPTAEEVNIKAGEYARESLEADENRLPGLRGKVDALISKLNFKKQFLNRYRLAKQVGGDPSAMNGIKDLIFLSSFSHGSEVLGGFYTIGKALLMDGAWETRLAMITGGLAIMVPGGVDVVCYIVIVPYISPNKIFGVNTFLPEYYRKATHVARVITVKGLISFAEYTKLKSYFSQTYEERNPIDIVETRAQKYNAQNRSYVIENAPNSTRYFVRPAARGVILRYSSNEAPLFELQFRKNERDHLNLTELVIHNGALSQVSGQDVRSFLKPFGLNVRDAVLEITKSLQDNTLEWQKERFFVENLQRDETSLRVKFKEGGLETWTRYQRRSMSQPQACGTTLN
ncbi:MAG: hypothetical protein AB7F59_11490 [Bdellovibrionales bacterium]